MNIDSLDKNKVVLGLSGGVDSTAAALLLKEKGLEVIGLYFNVHEMNEEKAKSGIDKAKKMANELGIKLVLRDVQNAFRSCVINNFKSEYEVGRTPNPCIICNPNIKFQTLLDVANEEGAFYIATGHYAQVSYSRIQQCKTIRMSKNEKKDQSYMLYRVRQDAVDRLIFPLGEVEDKSITRSMVKSENLSNAEDKDSQEICFIDDSIAYEDYLANEGITFEEGDFIDIEGNYLGKHKGIGSYTIGQRKGLGIAIGRPAFVTDIDYEAKTVTLGSNEDLLKKEVNIGECYFHSSDSEKLYINLEDKSLKAKIRYKAEPASCKLEFNSNGNVTIIFDEAQRAPAPGQSAVIYLDDEILGGGFINRN